MPGGEPFDAGAFRRALGAFPTGVTVVTALAPDGAPVGMTANSFTSVSLDPPLVLVCIGSGSSSFAAFAAASAFAVNVLGEGDAEVAARFARRGIDRFAGVALQEGITGSPLLAGAHAWFDCVHEQRIVAGDHVILIGRVQDFGAGDGAPLGFARGRYATIRHGETGPAPAETTVAAYLVEHGGRLLLRQRADGSWTLPTARRPKPGRIPSLDGAPGLRLRPEDTVIYSVYDDPADDRGFLVYRSRLDLGETLPEPEACLAWHEAASLPFDRIESRPLAALVRRYLAERSNGRFGIYFDTADGGRVAVLAGDPRPYSSHVPDGSHDGDHGRS